PARHVLARLPLRHSLVHDDRARPDRSDDRDRSYDLHREARLDDRPNPDRRLRARARTRAHARTRANSRSRSRSRTRSRARTRPRPPGPRPPGPRRARAAEAAEPADDADLRRQHQELPIVGSLTLARFEQRAQLSAFAAMERVEKPLRIFFAHAPP